MKRPFFKRIFMSFSSKLFAFMVSVIILLTCTFSLFSLHSQQQNFEKEMMLDGMMHARMLADNARLGLFARDRRQLEAALSNVLIEDKVIGACVFDLAGNLLQRKITGELELTDICRRQDRLGSDTSINTFQQVAHFEDEATVEFWSPVLAKPSEFSEEGLFFPEEEGVRSAQTLRIGTIGVVFDKTAIRQSIREMVFKNILILLFFLAVGSIATYFLVQGATEPLNRLLEEIKAKAGKTEESDDLGLLTDTYSGMVRSLSDSFATINTLKSGLEIKVDELEQEIARRQGTEAALRESEEKFRNISEGIADGVAIVREGIFIWLNKAFGNIFGCGIDDLLGQEAKMLLPWPGQTAGAPWLGDSLAKPEAQLRYVIEACRKDGRDILVEASARRIIFENQMAIQVIIRDITELDRAEKRRKELEIKALAQSKLASLGKIATGVAHEINQPLSYIRVTYESALQDIDKQQLDPAEVRDYFREALRQVGRITKITDHLRHFGRSDTSQFEQLQMPEVLANSLTLMGEILRLGQYHPGTGNRREPAHGLGQQRAAGAGVHQSLSEQRGCHGRKQGQKDSAQHAAGRGDARDLFFRFRAGYRVRGAEEHLRALLFHQERWRTGPAWAWPSSIRSSRSTRAASTYADLPGWGASFRDQTSCLPRYGEQAVRRSGPGSG